MKKTKSKLHKEVDAYWRPIAQKCSPWAVLEIMRMWAYEKEYVDKFGRRVPRIVNITSPGVFDSDDGQ